MSVLCLDTFSDYLDAKLYFFSYQSPSFFHLLMKW